MWKRVLFVIAAVLVLGTGYSGFERLPLFGDRPTLRLIRLPAPAVQTMGRLTWLAGAKLESDDPMVGGFSALAVKGRRFTLLNDGGNFAGFTLAPGPRAAAIRFGALPAGPGSGWEKRDRDSESLVVGPDGDFWIGFERANAVWHYAPDFARAHGSARPSAMRDWSSNGGAEAMVRLRDGRFVIFAEDSRWRGRPGLAALSFAGDPVVSPERVFRFNYQPAPGYEVTDAALLADGDIIILERRWLLPLRFRSRLALVKASATKPGALVKGVELGRIVAPWPTENYEGVAATREGNNTILWLLSDNDQMSWRSSYLLKLRLDSPPQTRPARSRPKL